MQPIPVDDYQVPYSPRHLLHDIWSIGRKSATMRMELTVSHGSASSFRVNMLMRSLASGCGLVDKRKYGGWTLLVFHIGDQIALYHAVRDKYDVMPQSQPVKFKYKNYTGEFIRVIRSIPEYKIPMYGPWLYIKSIERILDRKSPMLLTIQSVKQRWGISIKEVHRRLFKDYPDILAADYKNWCDMTGYEVLRQYGYLDDK